MNMQLGTDTASVNNWLIGHTTEERHSMTGLFSRYGTPRQPNAFDAKGKPLYRYATSCTRCGGRGGCDKWAHTGWSCYRCGGKNSAHFEEHTEKLYTAEKLAQLNATASKRQSRRDAEQNAKAAAAAAERRAEFAAFQASSGHAAEQCLEHLAILARNGVTPQFAATFEQRMRAGEIVSEQHLDLLLGAIVRKLAETDQRTASQWVGQTGATVTLTLTVEKIMSFESDGWPRIHTHIHLCRDEQGNRVVYKGSKYLCDEGEQVTVKATVKEHGERNGEKQTIIARPRT